MRTRRSNPLQVSRLRPLAACLAIAFSVEISAGSRNVDSAVAPMHPEAARLSVSAEVWARAAFQVAFEKSTRVPDHPTTTLLVKNCNDAGPDSLREAVGLAADGATIQFDTAAMQCSTITLKTGQIDITVDNLAIHGPGADALTIDGGYDSGYYNRIFHQQSASGVLEIAGLTLTDAKYVDNANQQAAGGCVYSRGTVQLFASTINRCGVVGIGTSASGGGISAGYSVQLINSTVSDCTAFSDQFPANGGGIAAGTGTFTAKYSVIDNNVAQGDVGTGGGLDLAGSSQVTIQRSTISRNEAERAGGLYTHGPTILSATTISGNKAVLYGGAEVNSTLKLYNSTIAFNKATGFHRIAGIYGWSLESNSSIFAYNVTDDGNGAVATDVKVGDGLVSGASNLIIATNAMTPADTLSSCPRLAPLLDNGGLTRTHALLPGSPALDVGNNAENLDTDQRGIGFDRIVGSGPDIGAYEWSDGSGDVINSSGFEDCN